MAARRVAKTTVDWAALSERINHSQKDHLRAFKAKSDAFVSRVHHLPAEMPNIDFSLYKSRVSNKAMVDEFEKAFKAVSVAYPKDKDSIMDKLAKEEKVVEGETQKFVSQMELKKSEYQSVLSKIDSVPPPDKMTDEMYAHYFRLPLSKIDSVPPPDKMTHQMYAHYFPDSALDPVNRPTLWPHTADGNRKDMLR